MKKIARRNFLKLVGVSASIPILQSLPIASASATDLSDYPLLKDGMQRLNITAKGIRPLERFDLYHRKESHALRFSCFNGNFGRNVPRFFSESN